MEIAEILAKNIKLYRERLHLTQEDLAGRCSPQRGDHLDVFDELEALSNRSYISDIENCRRNITLDKIGKLATALEVEPYQLFLTKDIGERL